MEEGGGMCRVKLSVLIEERRTKIRGGEKPNQKGVKRDREGSSKEA